MKLRRKLFAAVSSLAVAAAVLLTGCGAPAQEGTALKETGILTLSVNPEIQIEYNRDGKVTALTGRNDDGKVSIDPVERTHRDEVRDTGDGRVKHKGEDYELEHPAAAREFDLSERVSRERGEEQVSESTDDRDEHSVEYVSRERHPRCGHELEEVGEVLESRAHHVEARREHPQLVKRLQGLHDNVEHRKEHERAHDDEQHVDSDIASDRTVEDNFMFSGSESCHIIVPPSIIIS